MPLLTRESLAHRFRQNWLAKHPIETTNANVDDSLTSLNWLQNLNIMKMASPTPPASPPDTSKILETAINCSEIRVNPNSVLNMTNIPVKSDTYMTSPLSLNCKLSPGYDVAPPTPTTPSTSDNLLTDYKNNQFVKPPYSYATLICMAMKESTKNKITLAGIYNWITDNFMYYRVADPSWQNSIRHNLSLNKCFQKVPRRKDEPGKGGFWRINPEYSDMFVNGIFKKRRTAPRETLPTCPPPKKIRREVEDSIVSSRNPNLSHGFSSEDLSQEGVLRLAPGEEINETLRGDFNWNAILHQDIDVGGVRIKTEDLIDDGESDVVATPITTLSPPPSDSNSDVALDDLLATAADLAAHFEDPVDISSGALDLTVQGYGIRPPDWWSENSTTKDSTLESSSGLHTPISASPIHEATVDDTDFSHPWAESRAELDEAIASFDLDLQNLFDENIAAVSSISDS